jgi:hypothetical protein
LQTYPKTRVLLKLGFRFFVIQACESTLKPETSKQPFFSVNMMIQALEYVE